MRLGVEPEPGNVVRDARTAARLLAELGDDAPVGIVLDPANLLTPETISRQSEILAEAVDLLGPRVVGVQAKDVVASGAAAAGTGLLDYPAVLRSAGPTAPGPADRPGRQRGRRRPGQVRPSALARGPYEPAGLDASRVVGS